MVHLIKLNTRIISVTFIVLGKKTNQLQGEQTTGCMVIILCGLFLWIDCGCKTVNVPDVLLVFANFLGVL